MEIVKTISRRVALNDEGVMPTIEVFSSDLENGYCTMSSDKDAIEGYWGDFSITMPKAFAKALGEALIAVAEE